MNVRPHLLRFLWQLLKQADNQQASNASGKPILFFTDYAAGHSHFKQKVFESIADVLAFGLWQTGAPPSSRTVRR